MSRQENNQANFEFQPLQLHSRSIYCKMTWDIFSDEMLLKYLH